MVFCDLHVTHFPIPFSTVGHLSYFQHCWFTLCYTELNTCISVSPGQGLWGIHFTVKPRGRRTWTWCRLTNTMNLYQNDHINLYCHTQYKTAHISPQPHQSFILPGVLIFASLMVINVFLLFLLLFLRLIVGWASSVGCDAQCVSIWVRSAGAASKSHLRSMFVSCTKV